MKKIIIALLAVLMVTGCALVDRFTGGSDFDPSGDKLYCVMDSSWDDGSSELTAYYSGDEVNFVEVVNRSPQKAEDLDVILFSAGLATKPLNAIKGFEIEMKASDDKDFLVTIVRVDYEKIDWEAFDKLWSSYGDSPFTGFTGKERSVSYIKEKAEADGFSCN